jgi:hypothetical protein
MDHHEIELSEHSFLWLAEAGHRMRSSVYDFLAERVRAWRKPESFFVYTCPEGEPSPGGFEIALWRSPKRVFWLVDIGRPGKIDSSEWQSKLHYIGLADVKLPGAARFDLNRVGSGEDFAKLVDAIAEFGSSGWSARSDRDAAAPRMWLAETDGLYRQLPQPAQLNALRDTLRRTAGAIWGVADARQNMKMILDGAKNKPQVLKRAGEEYYVLHAATFDSFADKPTADDDLQFFFSRRAPYDLPDLSRGRSRAPSFFD